MVVMEFTLELSGPFFSPKALLAILPKDEFKVGHALEPDLVGINESIDDQAPFGALDLKGSSDRVIANRPSNHLKWYVDFLAVHKQAITGCGCTRVNLAIDAYYSDQCNFELFDVGALGRVSPDHPSVSLRISMITRADLAELLSDMQTDDEEAQYYIRNFLPE